MGLLVFLFGVEVVGKRDADVVVQRVLPLVGLLIGGLTAPTLVVLVEDILGKEPDIALVLQDFPSDGGTPKQEVTVHATGSIAAPHILGESCGEDKVAVVGLELHAVIVVPQGGVLDCRLRET